MFKQRGLGILIGILILFSGTVGWAAGSSDSDSSSQPRRVDPDYKAAQAAIKTWDYKRALMFLKRADRADPNNADILNLMGYSYRKLGDFDKGEQFYLQALNIDPEHLGANEYLGELYLETNRLAKAKERLKALDDICVWGCSEYTELKKAIDDYIKKNNS